MKEAEVRRIVAEMFGIDPDVDRIAIVHVRGNVSQKDIGELVGRASLHTKFVVLDASQARTVGGHRPWWRPGRRAKGG